MANINSLLPEIKYRTGIRPSGTWKRLFRKQGYDRPPSYPKLKSQYESFMYVCPITKEYIVASRSDVRNDYVCYQTFKKRTPAIMYTIMVATTKGASE